MQSVSAILVTRGDVDISEILASIPYDDIVVWDNSAEEHDLGVYGRYAAISRARHDVIYVQDDDCVLASEAFEVIQRDYDPGCVVANMSDYHRLHHRDDALLGFGAMFHRDLPEAAFARWPVGLDPLFLRTCDVVFTALSERRQVTAPFRYLPWSSTAERMSKQPGFAVERQQVLDSCIALLPSSEQKGQR